ncbi:FAD binding domain-containing protein [Pseudonocardia nematodicida]|uniref:FAD binding domain-containing protein n=1 Tax=Pseudonocardia nematodicida TaxID=1206997 RepID=A0ABV1K4X0_9PSEU
MKDFAYARAGSVDDVVAALSDPGTAVLAGGTELLNWLRLGIAEPDRVVDIADLGLDDIGGDGGSALVIGARATLNAVGGSPLVAEHAGALSSACLQAASAQIRHRATLGGNVLQRPRCPYFRTEAPVPWPCNKREPGSGCASLAGRHERQAVFGGTDGCVAVQPSDPAVALAALDATADVVGPAGWRSIPMREFHLSQAEAAATGEPMREHRLDPGELILSYRIPVRGDRSAYVKVRERASYEYAIVSAAGTVRLGDDGRIAAARIALGSVAQRPWRLDDAEAALVGLPATREALLPVVDAALPDAAPLAQNAFKVPMARNAAVRALLLAAGGAA